MQFRVRDDPVREWSGNGEKNNVRFRLRLSGSVERESGTDKAQPPGHLLVSGCL